jgi:hypothetical protein
MRSVTRTFILIASALLAVVALEAPASATVCSPRFDPIPKRRPRNGDRRGGHRARRPARVLRPPPRRHRRPGRAGYNVRYVDQVTADGSGAVVPTPGGARLQVIVRHPSISPIPLPNTADFRTFRSVTNTGSFEGQTTYGLGVRARLPFRVFTIAGGHGRIVVDVAHHWTA